VHREAGGAHPRRRGWGLHGCDAEHETCDTQSIKRRVRRKVAKLGGRGEEDERRGARKEEEEAALLLALRGREGGLERRSSPVGLGPLSICRWQSLSR
jgi:hypothetical protein